MIKDDRWLILIDQLWMNAWLPLSRLLQCVQCAAKIYKALCSVQLCTVQFDVCAACPLYAVCAQCHNQQCCAVYGVHALFSEVYCALLIEQYRDMFSKVPTYF